LNDPVDVFEQNRSLHLAFQSTRGQVKGFHAVLTDSGKFIGATTNSLILREYYLIPFARFD